MGLLDRFWKKDKPAPAVEHAVIVQLVLTDDEFGSTEERDAIRALSRQLAEQLERAGAGDFDGDEFGGGKCTLWMYGPDADRLFAVVEPTLRASPLVRGGHAIKRFGSASDDGATRVRVDF